MSRRPKPPVTLPPPSTAGAINRRAATGGLLGLATLPAWAVNYPVTPGQRSTAQKVAEAGVPLSELAPNAPDSHTVKRGDTLWDISKLFLRSPWRWPELWGMNLEQIRNPHLIYPGQVLYLDKSGGRARLVMAKPIADSRLSPRIRTEALENQAITAVSMSRIGPFLNEAVVFDTNQLEQAPRIVATQEGRMLVSRGEKAYVRGDLGGTRTWHVFRQPKPLKDPSTGEVLGFEARFVGAADLIRTGEVRPAADGKDSEVIPATVTLTRLREEAGVGDRLAPAGSSDHEAFMPHAPGTDLNGQIVSIYGDGLNAGQNQIVAINRGAKDGVERGHVMALWQAGAMAVDRTSEDKARLRLPDERQGLLFVFRVFERVSYGLVLQVEDPVQIGDRVSSP